MSQAGKPSVSSAGVPVPVPRDASRVLLFGGVFDPPHIAHTGLAAAARDAALGPDAWLVLVPAARSPLKPEGAAAPDQDRVEMLRLAINGIDRAALWTDEIERARASGGQPSYWIDTLRQARATLGPDAEVRFLIGADQALQFHRWRACREILELAAPVVLLRSPAQTPDSLMDGLRQAGTWRRDDLERWRQWILELPVASPSSSDIRTLFVTGREDEAAKFLDPKVMEYIRSRGLYGVGSPPSA